MATIKDVAQKAGVSVATVSRVINRADNVGQEIRQRVQEAIDELGYEPNSFARSLKKKTFHTIGVILSDLAVPFHFKIMKKIESSFRDEGYMVLFVNTYDDPDIEKKGIRMMMEKQADVLLVCSTGFNEDYLSRLQKKGLKVIFFDRRPKKHQFPTFYVDKRRGMYDILSLLTGLGHRKMAFVSGARSLSTNYDRYLGITDFTYEKELPVDIVDCRFREFSEAYGYGCCGELLSAEDRATAIITGSALLATGVMLYCREHGVRIPDDLSLISFGDLTSGALIEPRLSYVDDGNVELGELLVEKIRAAIAGDLDPGDQVALPANLVINQSVCPAVSQTNTVL